MPLAPIQPYVSLVLLSSVLTLALPSCRKEAAKEQAPPSTTTETSTALRVEHHVDGNALQFDTLQYTNAAGHTYSVTRLQYYLCALTLIGTSGTPDHTIAGPWYVDASLNPRYNLGTLPSGSYSGATVHLGLIPSLNLTGALPNTLDNVNMAWPDMMGGGYHFMKLEGHFAHTGQTTGFAMHLGRDANLPICTLPYPITLDGSSGTIVLRFNINEVFRTPHTYDLETGNQSMGSMALMGLLRDNCADAFALQQHP